MTGSPEIEYLFKELKLPGYFQVNHKANLDQFQNIFHNDTFGITLLNRVKHMLKLML